MISDYRVTKDDSSYEWICEGRHPVPANLDDTSYKLPRYVKLRKESVKSEKIKEKKPCRFLNELLFYKTIISNKFL